MIGMGVMSEKDLALLQHRQHCYSILDLAMKSFAGDLNAATDDDILRRAKLFDAFATLPKADPAKSQQRSSKVTPLRPVDTPLSS